MKTFLYDMWQREPETMRRALVNPSPIELEAESLAEAVGKIQVALTTGYCGQLATEVRVWEKRS